MSNELNDRYKKIELQMQKDGVLPEDIKNAIECIKKLDKKNSFEIDEEDNEMEP